VGYKRNNNKKVSAHFSFCSTRKDKLVTLSAINRIPNENERDENEVEVKKEGIAEQENQLKYVIHIIK
jgi:flagellar basal body rod protein FlgB